jgi:hypothetical protein
MRHPTAAFLALPLLAPIALLVGCSGGMNRQLESISVSPATGSGAPVSYKATGTFTSSPTTVTPLAVSWFMMGPAIDPPGPEYMLTKGDFTAWRCRQANPVASTYTIIAVAPADPNAPNSGSMPSQVFSDLVIQHTKSSEGGFVAGTAKLGCS